MAYQRRKPQPLPHIRCPECGVPMVERSHPERGSFYGCMRFPLCVGTRGTLGGPTSYYKLLRVAYDKALVFLSGRSFLGAEAQQWMLAHALGLGEGESPPENFDSSNLAEATMECGIDAAIEYIAGQGVDHDFLVAAHNERMLGIKSRLHYSTAPQHMRNMPTAEIHRRYDTGVLEQFEASITTDWTSDGQHCPRCGGWAETGIQVAVASMETFEEPSTKTFECAECGIFTKKGHVYTYDNDKGSPGVVEGISLGTTTFKRKEEQ